MWVFVAAGLALLLWAAQPVLAAPEQGKAKGDRVAKMQQRLEKLTKALDLTEEQQGQVRALLDAQVAKLRDILRDKGLQKDEKRAKAQDLFIETQQEIRKLLTPDQQTKFDKACEKAKARLEARKNKGVGEAGQGGQQEDQGEEGQ
jgi:Spy/CpxP family protein refolding chaperone